MAKPNLDEGLLSTGRVTYDEQTDEYVSANGVRLSREDWHTVLPDDPEAESKPHQPLTEEDFNPRNVREKQSIWFHQDILDEIKRLSTLQPGTKIDELINHALRFVYLPKTLTSPAKD